jgi:hypothetical protein
LLVASYGDGQKAVVLLRSSRENGVYHIQYPEQYLVFTDLIGTQLYYKDKNRAKEYLQDTMNTYHDVEKRIEGFKFLPSPLRPEYPYELTPSMRLHAAEAAYYLGQWNEANRLIEPILTMKKIQPQDALKAKALFAAIQGKLGRPVDTGILQDIQKDKQVEYYYDRMKKLNV